MNQRIWLDVPVTGTEEGDSVQPKYDISCNVFLVYRGDRVLAALEDEQTATTLLSMEGVRRLDPQEIRAVELEYPYIPLRSPDVTEEPGPIGLGDAVGWLASKLGLRECGSCRRRRRGLNRVVVWGWWRD